MANVINWVTQIFYKNKTKVFPIEDINDEDIYPEQNQEISEYKENTENTENKNTENKNTENKNIDDIIEDFNKISIKPKRNVKFDEKKSIIN